MFCLNSANFITEMSDNFDPNPSFKRDIAHVFDAVNAYLVLKKKLKLKRIPFEFILVTILRQDLWDILVWSKQVIFALFWFYFIR